VLAACAIMVPSISEPMSAFQTLGRVGISAGGK
jgi:hypothetical protein